MAVLAAREADHDAVPLLDHVEVGDRLPDLSPDALGELAGLVIPLARIGDADGVDGHAQALDKDGAPTVDGNDLARDIRAMARKCTAWAMSSGPPTRASGVVATMRSR